MFVKYLYESQPESHDFLSLYRSLKTLFQEICPSPSSQFKFQQQYGNCNKNLGSFNKVGKNVHMCKTVQIFGAKNVVVAIDNLVSAQLSVTVDVRETPTSLETKSSPDPVGFHQIVPVFADPCLEEKAYYSLLQI